MYDTLGGWMDEKSLEVMDDCYQFYSLTEEQRQAVMNQFNDSRWDNIRLTSTPRDSPNPYFLNMEKASVAVKYELTKAWSEQCRQHAIESGKPIMTFEQAIKALEIGFNGPVFIVDSISEDCDVEQERNRSNETL